MTAADILLAVVAAIAALAVVAAWRAWREAQRLRERMERAGTAVTFVFVPPPGEHPANDLLAGVFLVLGFLMRSFKSFVNLAMILSFVTGPLLGFLARNARDGQSDLSQERRSIGLRATPALHLAPVGTAGRRADCADAPGSGGGAHTGPCRHH